MAPPLAPSPPPLPVDPFKSNRTSIDEEENAGLLNSYYRNAAHGEGEDYPPPPSPPTPSLPFSKARGKRFIIFSERPFLSLSIFLFLAVFLAASTFNHYAPMYNRLSRGDGAIRAKMHEQPRVELDKTNFRIEESKMPRGDYSVTAIVLHGLGQPNNEPPFVRKLAARFPYVRWISPTADELNVTVRGYEPTSAWFNIETFDDLSQGENLEEFVHSQQQLNKLVDDEREKMREAGKEPRIALMGFSQGAVMTMLGLLTADETSRLEAGIALSGYVPLLNYLDDIVSPASRDIPLFWGHGKQDPYLTIEQARAGSSLLRSSRVGLRKLTYKEYEGLDHIWNEEELDDVVDWFQRTIPRKRLGRPSSPSSLKSPSTSPSASSDADSPPDRSSVDAQQAANQEGSQQSDPKWEKVQLDNAAEAKARRSLRRRQQTIRGVA
ncbi:hypothetical protein JCM3765_000567 [Sporobolomyces pararoseus]